MDSLGWVHGGNLSCAWFSSGRDEICVQSAGAELQLQQLLPRCISDATAVVGAVAAALSNACRGVIRLTDQSNECEPLPKVLRKNQGYHVYARTAVAKTAETRQRFTSGSTHNYRVP